MNNEEKRRYVIEYLLKDAIDSIESNRRYWNPSISRNLTSALVDALDETGYPVFVWEIPPQWEHVFYLQEDASFDNNNEVEAIAEKRFELMEKGVEQSQLPR